MAPLTLPIAHDQSGDDQLSGTPKVARERRELEQVIADWESEAKRLGHHPTLMTLNTTQMIGERWAYRFVIAVSPVPEQCVLIFYGYKFAALLDLPVKPIHSIPMIHQLPRRFVPLFSKGCADAITPGVPVRMEGEIKRQDGRRELYRALFINFRNKPDGRSSLALGTFNFRVAPA